MPMIEYGFEPEPCHGKALTVHSEKVGRWYDQWTTAIGIRSQHGQRVLDYKKCNAIEIYVANSSPNSSSKSVYLKC